MSHAMDLHSHKRLRILLNHLSPDTTATVPSSTTIISPTSTSTTSNSTQVSIVTDISSIYDSQSLPSQRQRYNSLISLFNKTYNTSPDFIIRSPGRVNIIGEHIDYCGYDVLPMAVEKDILFICKRINPISSNKVEISLVNTESHFKPKLINICNLNEINIDLSSSHRDWSDYFKAGLSGVLKEFNNDINGWKYGLEILVDGTLPKGSGLSSSSAFVCGSVVSLLYGNNLNKLNKNRIAKTCIKCEKEVGVDAGGMDQTICMMASKGYAKHVKFIPKLMANSVKLPKADKYSFVIANCLKEHKLMDNFGTRNYNTRVVECRLATLIVARKMNIKNWERISTMRELQDACGATLDEMISNTLKYLNNEPYSLDRIEKSLGIDNFNSKYSLEDFMFGLNTGKTVIKNLRKTDYKLPLQYRMLHVYNEAKRVLQFANICSQNSNNMSSELVAKQLGNLMSDSHNSCDKMYDCSCNELNKLQSICMKGGSLGSRLTGAGWGGCVVSLVNKTNVNNFINFVQNRYYSDIQNVPQGAIFETVPSAALTVVDYMVEM